jgi:hypothetical protein
MSAARVVLRRGYATASSAVKVNIAISLRCVAVVGECEKIGGWGWIRGFGVGEEGRWWTE